MIAERDLYSVLVVAKKVDDAISEGLAALEATLDKVQVEVVESGGIFRKAKVRITLERDEDKKEEPKEEKKEHKAEKPEKPVEKKSEPKPAKKQEGTEKPVKEQPAPADKADKDEKPIKQEKSVKQKKPASPPKQAESPAEQEKPQKPTREEADAALDKAYEFVKEVVAKMGFTAQVEQDSDDKELINIDAPAGDDSLIIGRHGETLAALSYLAETGARADKCRVSVTVDCNGYRGRRAASLTAMAHRRADEAVNKGRRIKLDAMERIDRRTVHNALTDDDRVTTASEGKEPYRYVVITPKTEHKGGHRRGGRHHKYDRNDKPSDVSADNESTESQE